MLVAVFATLVTLGYLAVQIRQSNRSNEVIAMRGTESGWIQLRWKLVDADDWLGFERSLAFIIGSQGGRRAYERNENFLSPKFVDSVDRMLEQADPGARAFA